jgi:CrcB protein
MIPFLWVCCGGALGSGARYLVGAWASAAFGPGFPFGTLIVNVVGSFLIGLVMRLSLTTGLVPGQLRLFLTTGILGGFTTYSSFNHETLRLLDDGDWGSVAINLGGTVLGCLLAGLAGMKVADLVSAWSG